MSALELKVYELFKKRFSEDEAQIVIEYFEAKAEEKILQKKDIFLTKDDKIDIIKNIYTANIIQFVATVGSVLAIVSFMK
jgi:hypothetical protein